MAGAPIRPGRRSPCGWNTTPASPSAREPVRVHADAVRSRPVPVQRRAAHAGLANARGPSETRAGVVGVRSPAGAPNAERVSVVGDFNRWTGAVHRWPAAARAASGAVHSGLPADALYKFELRNRATGAVMVKADPTPAASSCVRARLRAYARHRITSGATRAGWPRGRRATGCMRRSTSTRFTPVPGSVIPTAASTPTESSPSTSCPTWWTWVTRTSS